MKLQDALNKKVKRVRKKIWANPNAYLRLPVFDNGATGIWANLFDDRVQKDVLGIEPGSQAIPLINSDILNDRGWFIYNGPVSEYDKA